MAIRGAPGPIGGSADGSWVRVALGAGASSPARVGASTSAGPGRGGASSMAVGGSPPERRATLGGAGSWASSLSRNESMGGWSIAETARASGPPEKRICRYSAVIVHRVFYICGIIRAAPSPPCANTSICGKGVFTDPCRWPDHHCPANPPARQPGRAGRTITGQRNTCKMACSITDGIRRRMSRQLGCVNGLYTLVRACERDKRKLSTYSTGSSHAGPGPLKR